MQKQQAVHTAGGQRREFYFSPIKYAIPIPIRTILIPIPIHIPICSPKLLSFPWESYGNGNSHSHAHLYISPYHNDLWGTNIRVSTTSIAARHGIYNSVTGHRVALSFENCPVFNFHRHSQGCTATGCTCTPGREILA